MNYLRELDSRSIVGSIYISLGLIGLLCNIATVIMIISKRVFRLSAYTMMANVALSDAIMLIVAGVVCGLNLIWPTMDQCLELETHKRIDNFSEIDSTLRRYFFFHYTSCITSFSSDPSNDQTLSTIEKDNCHLLSYCLSFFEITSWTAGVVSYAYLGLNRCVAICFYGTKAKIFNQVTVAVVASVSTWLIGIIPGRANQNLSNKMIYHSACIGTFPTPLVGNLMEMWSISFKSINGQRSGRKLFTSAYLRAYLLCT